VEFIPLFLCSFSYNNDMASLLLALIYLAFISLGLPDSLIGAAWPIIYQDMNVDVSYLGIISFLMCMGTILSSLFSDKLIIRFGCGKVTAVSTLLSACTLFLFSICDNFVLLMVLSLPFGMAAGAIDSALNNYVALHYSGSCMNFLHCFWGVGAVISPNIMSYALGQKLGYQGGYRYVFFIQLIIALILFASLSLWNKVKESSVEEETKYKVLTFKEKFQIKGIYYVIFGFLSYCAIEGIMFNWSATYLVLVKGVSEELAAANSSLYFLGMMSARAISGFISNKLGDRKMIIIGSSILALGIVIMIVPFNNDFLSLLSLFVVGFGCGPIYPAIIHSTPDNFSKENSQAIIGLQMAAAYTGSAFTPIIFGVLIDLIGCQSMPYFMSIILIMQSIMLSKLYKMTLNKK